MSIPSTASDQQRKQDRLDEHGVSINGQETCCEGPVSSYSSVVYDFSFWNFFSWLSKMAISPVIAVLNLFRPKETTLLRVFKPNRNEVYNNLIRELKDTIKPAKYNVEWKVCEELNVISKTPLLVICMNISRIGVDIERALQNVNSENFIILLIVHIKGIHVLPMPETTLEPRYKYVKHVIDVAYTSDKGLYNCEMNIRAMESFATILENAHKHYLNPH